MAIVQPTVFRWTSGWIVTVDRFELISMLTFLTRQMTLKSKRNASKSLKMAIWTGGTELVCFQWNIRVMNVIWSNFNGLLKLSDNYLLAMQQHHVPMICLFSTVTTHAFRLVTIDFLHWLQKLKTWNVSPLKSLMRQTQTTVSSHCHGIQNGKCTS